MAKNLSEVFRETNEILWDGIGLKHDVMLPFICITMRKLKNTKSSLIVLAQSIITQRLGVSPKGYTYVIESWLDANGICKHQNQNRITIQQYRKAWLTELEKEFKNK